MQNCKNYKHILQFQSTVRSQLTFLCLLEKKNSKQFPSCQNVLSPDHVRDLFCSPKGLKGLNMQNPIPTSDKSQGIYKGLLASIKSPDFSLLIFQVFISEISANEHVFVYVYISKCAYSKHGIVKISPICSFFSLSFSCPLKHISTGELHDRVGK